MAGKWPGTCPEYRDRHGYGKTCGFSKMGSTSTGMVVDFGTLWHTTYPYCGITGMGRASPIFTVLNFLFFLLFLSNSLCRTVTQPNVAVPAMCTLLLTFVIAHPYKVSYKTNNPFVFQELLTYNASGKYSKVSIEISINMLIMLYNRY